MDNQELKDKFKFRVSLYEMKQENDIENKREKSFFYKKAMVACACLVFMSGVVFSKEIENVIRDKFGLGIGVQTAINNGYIAHSKDDFNYSDIIIYKNESDKNKEKSILGVKIEDYIITDTCISLEFDLKFEKSLKEYFNIDELNNYELFGNLTFDNLYILDENNNLITSDLVNKSKDENFNNYCQKHNIFIDTENFNVLKGTINTSINLIDLNNNIIKLNTRIDRSDIPKSQKLNIYFDEIIHIPRNNTLEKAENTNICGNWKISLEVPEKMYNREDIFYKVINSENDNFNIYTAKATDIGFEIGLNISNIELPKVQDIFIDPQNNLEYLFNSREELLAVSTEKDFEKDYIEYRNLKQPIRLWGIPPLNWLERTDGCYILDENGNKFYHTRNNSKKQNENFVYDKIVDENGFVKRICLNEFDFYDEFSITKYNLTEKLLLVIDYYGNPVKIELQMDN